MRLFGHPVHPMLVHFPVACWTLGTACDGLALFGIRQAWPVAGLFLTIGVATALPAFIAGFIDLIALPEKAVQTGNIHMTLMGAAWTLYLAALLLRSKGWVLAAQPGWATVALSFAGFLLMAVGSYYGGQLVYRFGAGLRGGHEKKPGGI